MAATVTDDFTTVKDMENTTGVTEDGNVVGSTGSTSNIFFAQGSNSVIGQFKASGVGGMGFQAGSNQDWRQRHVMGWINNLDVANTAANGGWRMRLESVGDSGSWGTNFGDYYCGGRDTLNVFTDRFLFLCADVMRPFDASGGTLNRNAARTLGVVTNATSGSGQSTWFQDELKYGTGITVTAGTVGVPGVSADILSSDRSNGRGTFQDANGALAVTGTVAIGDTGTASSHFADQAEKWNFSALPVKNDFHKLVLQGNATGTNNATFGTKTGTGVDEEASGGNTFASAGEVPFQVEAIDSNVDEGGFYGTSFVGPAALRDDPWRNVFQEDNSGASFVDITDAANDSATGTAFPFPTGSGVNDACYFGSDRIFSLLKVNTGTAGIGTYTVTWEYWNGSAWAALTDVTDGTGNFKTTGLQTVDYAVPDDWATTAVNSNTRFWVRARRDAGTSTTRPVITQAFCPQGGNIRLEASSIKAIRCLILQMETVRVRNGAFLKKSIITGSVAPAKHAALDLGSTDPAADTVRDLTLSDALKGVLLKDVDRFLNAAAAVDKGGGLVGLPSTAHGYPTGKSVTVNGTTNYDGIHTVDATSSANEIVITATFVTETFATTDTVSPNEEFNVRNFQFSGFTNDFRVDFPANSTVTINLLEGTSSDTALTPANQNNVNSSTLVMNNAVTLNVQTNNPNDVGIQGIRVRIEETNGTLISQGETDATGLYSASYNYGGTPLAVRVKVRLKGWKFDRQGGEINSNGLSASFSLKPDGIVDRP